MNNFNKLYQILINCIDIENLDEKQKDELLLTLSEFLIKLLR